jgi:hypothetical protein
MVFMQVILPTFECSQNASNGPLSRHLPTRLTFKIKRRRERFEGRYRSWASPIFKYRGIFREANIQPTDNPILQPNTILHPKFSITHNGAQPLKVGRLTGVYIVVATAYNVCNNKCVLRITLGRTIIAVLLISFSGCGFTCTTLRPLSASQFTKFHQ